MKYVCEIEVPGNDTITKLDLMAKASRDETMWKPISSKPERMARTNLANKCGSCKHFCLWHDSESNGVCRINHPWGKRTRPACKDYEVVE